ncbi:hypothetical protein BaRGS_00024663 [Batillaria attramentaria]|uniref:Uncharacterized protein n=1 Tax=Batillaria attramentaria TaxID=370345 RepID=A0ABD0KA98_9CAEN
MKPEFHSARECHSPRSYVNIQPGAVIETDMRTRGKRNFLSKQGVPGQAMVKSSWTTDEVSFWRLIPARASRLIILGLCAGIKFDCKLSVTWPRPDWIGHGSLGSRASDAWLVPSTSPSY